MIATFSEIWAAAQPILGFLGAVGITLSATTLAAYGLFKGLGQKWIEGKLEHQLEAYRSEQSRELERLRYKINGVLDRTVRLNTREFEVLPDLWAKLLDAYDVSGGFAAPFQQNVPDVSFLND